jgi:hypothetical protein
MRTELQGRKARLITDVTSKVLGKKEMAACRLFTTNSLREGVMWHIDPLLGNDRETTRQWPLLRNSFVNM